MATISTSGVVSYQGDGLGSVMELRVASLPKCARDKLKSLDRAASKRAGAHNEITDRQEKIRKRITELSSEVNHADVEIERGWVKYSAADHAALEVKRREIADLRAELPALEEERRKLPSGIPPDAVLEWLRSEPSGRRYRACPVSVSLRKNETPLQALENNRREGREFESQKSAADLAPLPLVEAEAAVTAEVDRIARQGQPTFSDALRVGLNARGRRQSGSVKWPIHYLGGADAKEIRDGFALTVWANRDAIVARALEELKANYRPDDAMTMTERDLRKAECDVAILQLARLEEALVVMCEREGFAVSRRSDSPMLAVLGLEVDDRPRAAPKPEPEGVDDPAVVAADLRRARLRDPAVRSERKTMSDADESEFG